MGRGIGMRANGEPRSGQPKTGDRCGAWPEWYVNLLLRIRRTSRIRRSRSPNKERGFGMRADDESRSGQPNTSDRYGAAELVH